jgi:hypothetical protein
MLIPIFAFERGLQGFRGTFYSAGDSKSPTPFFKGELRKTDSEIVSEFGDATLGGICLMAASWA